MSSRAILLAFLLSALLLHGFATSATKGTADDADEDISFLLEGDDEDAARGFPSHDHALQGEDDHDDFDEDEQDQGDFSDLDEGSYEAPPALDEKDVVVLTEGNFSEFIEKNRHVMVEFYAPWCGHCRALAPEYAAAATALKAEDVVLAKIDATEENELAQKYDVQGFPTVYFFVDGDHKPYPGQRAKDAIVTWIKKRIGPAVQNITTTEEAEKILASETKLVLGFFDSLVGADSLELAAASKLEDDVNFYQTVSPDVAALFHIDPKAKRPSLVLLKKEAEKLTYFDGQFTKSAIGDFIFANKLPLVTTFTRETAPLIFESQIKKQLLLFAQSKDSEKILSVFQEAAKLFKGKLIFVHVEMDNEDVGKPVSDYFGVTGDGPKLLAYSGNEDGRKYILDGEVTHENIKAFGEDYLEDKLKPFYKSDQIPQTNDGDVKIVVGNNFDEIVLDESKDVLLEIYAPWCGHCQALEPTYNKLAKHLRGIESLVIAKMDGTTNEHPRAKSDGFPTLLFFPAGNKSFDPITVDTERTVVAFYKFLKKNASIPFKLQKPAAATKTEAVSEPKQEGQAKTDLKDEL
ncbi:protein disulfide isomerase-like 1-4 [Dendrobium catenatum]|uniref:Protein disulfide-isomerase n=1 Tax=Dendrobium catenatum TaxID=906689 RepID=A0A2I0VBW2_9ASPA|nr:protein disulfide isomerase-like 1-4 [Dendrobium catenatum]PKU60904.1 Protein disulfide isomerase-like 1-4 [Dendrobium catenatum]